MKVSRFQVLALSSALIAFGGIGPAQGADELADARVLSELGTGLNLITGEAKHKQLVAVDDRVKAVRKKLADEVIDKEYAESVSEMRSKMTIKASVEASYKLFKGKVDSSFERETKSSTKTHFMSKVVGAGQSHTYLEFEGDPDTLKPTPAFEKDLLDPKRSPAHLFEVYGTHVVMDYHLGGSALLQYSAKQTAQMTREKFTLAVEASYSGVAKVKASGSYSKETIRQASQLQSNLHIVVKGGTPETISNVQTLKSPEAWAAWHKALRDDPVTVQLEPKKQVAIWQLCKDRKRAQEIEDAFHTLQAKKVIENPVLLTSLSTKRGHHPKGDLAVPEDFKILSGGSRGVGSTLAPGDYKLPGGQHVQTSCPIDGSQGWHSSSTDCHDPEEGVVQTAVIAIYDPNDYWDVKSWQGAPDGPSLSPAASVSIGDGYVLTGGGARTTETGFPWMSHPTFSGVGSLTKTSLEREINAKEAHGFYVAEAERALTGWTVRAKPHVREVACTINAYAIGVKPADKVKNLSVETKAFIAQSEVGHHPSGHARASRGYRLIGGGAAVVGSRILLVRTMPMAGQDDGEDTIWSTMGTHRHYSGTGSVVSIAIGLKVTSTLAK